MRNKTLSTITGLALLLGVGTMFGADPSDPQGGTSPSTDTTRGTGTRNDGQRGQFSEKDWKFITEAARGGMAEVELGQLAKTKASNQAIRDFGDRMATDHKKANDELKQIVAKKGATLPTTLSHHENSTIEKFQKATGADFDEDYAEAMVKDHKTDVKAFEKASKDADDPDIKAFAAKYLPTLQEHLTMAEQNKSSLKK